MENRTTMHRKIVSILLIAFGLSAMLAGFLFYASNAMPYQDATPELLAAQAASARQWMTVFVSGATATAFGAALLWKRRRVRPDPAADRSR
jgi:nitrate reductase gamma subunit